MKAEKSCQKCIHYDMCGWKGEPYSGNKSVSESTDYYNNIIEYPARDYDKYIVGWYELHGRLCTEYKEKK